MEERTRQEKLKLLDQTEREMDAWLVGLVYKQKEMERQRKELLEIQAKLRDLDVVAQALYAELLDFDNEEEIT